MHTIKILCLLLLPVVSLAQVVDNFDDGNFASPVAWSGDATRFTIVSGKLKLQAPALAESSYLSTPSVALYEASWEFYLQMDFNPSSTNYAKVYVVSDQADLAHPVQGYFVKAGGTTDEVSLYRQDGAKETKIIDGTDGILNVATVKVKIRLARSASGRWELFADSGLTGTYTSQGFAVDQTYTGTSWFGFACVYTSTRSDKFWFDDVVISGIAQPDLVPPVVVDVAAPSATTIELVFSEPILAGSLLPEHFQLERQTQPKEVVVDDESVKLRWDPPLVNGVMHRLYVSGVKDLSGNEMLPVERSVLYFIQVAPVGPKDVMITEIMADPSPAVGSYTMEYVELLNRSAHPIRMEGWTLSDGSTSAEIPELILLPGSYFVLSSLDATNVFSSVNVQGVAAFPSINNDGDMLVLKAGSVTIDSVKFDTSWYRDAQKQEGGWSLERIDPDNPCGEEDNWTASQSPQGGTPGVANSVLTSKPDRTPPLGVSIVAGSEIELQLVFNEKLEKEDFVTDRFVLEPHRAIRSVQHDGSLRISIIQLEEPLLGGTAYTMQASVRDCNGNEGTVVFEPFGRAEMPAPGDLLINEILFDPRPGQHDFIELINVSRKFINAQPLRLANLSTQGVPINITPVTGKRQLGPGQIFVWTTIPDGLCAGYASADCSHIFQQELPSLPSTEGTVVLLDGTGATLDAVSYSSLWHSPLIRDRQGVSLERISLSVSANTASNWLSASASAGYATPGRMNSRAVNGQGETETVWVDPEWFEVGTGFTLLHFALPPGDWSGKAEVFSAVGLKLMELAPHQTLSNTGFFRWDGQNAQGLPVMPGYYIFYFEAYNTDGTVMTFRKRVIATR